METPASAPFQLELLTGISISSVTNSRTMTITVVLSSFTLSLSLFHSPKISCISVIKTLYSTEGTLYTLKQGFAA